MYPPFKKESSFTSTGWCASNLPDEVTLLALVHQNILVRNESLQSNGPLLVDPSSADPYLGTETIAKTVREGAGRVDGAHERGSG